MALKGLWKLKGKVELDARLVVANTSGGKRQNAYMAVVEVQDPEGEVVLDTINATVPYVVDAVPAKLVYWALQFRNPKLVPDQPAVGDPPKEFIQALQQEQALQEAEQKATAARQAAMQASADAQALQPK